MSVHQFSRNGHSVKDFAEYFSDPTKELVDRLEAEGFDPRPTSNGMWEAFCPAHADLGISRNRNLQVSVGDDGQCLVHCFGRKCRPEDIVGAVGMRLSQLFPRRCPQKRHVGNGSVKPKDSRRRSSTSRDAAAYLIRDFGEPEAVYEYTPDFLILRFRDRDGNKNIKPVSRNEEGWAICDPEKSGLPLYNLETITSLPKGSTVWVVEGEKCVEILRGLGIVATTSCHGCGSAAKTDWSPLSPYKVVLNPDHDKPGEEFVESVVKLLAALPEPPEVRVVRFQELTGEGDDVEQWLEMHDSWDVEQCIANLTRLIMESPVLKTVPERGYVTLADIALIKGDQSRFLCDHMLIRHHFNLLSADRKVGKTHVALDLARRIYFAEPWPNGDPPSFPRGTPTIWVPGDQHQDELLERAEVMGIPLESIILTAPTDNPYGGYNLDDPVVMKRLSDLVDSHHPGLVFIDTVWKCTSKQLHVTEDVNALLSPLIAIAQEKKTTILGLMHVSKDGGTLGKRLEGPARAVWTLTDPDPSQPMRRRLEIIGNFKRPPAFGITLHDQGCIYDLDPPEDPCSPGARRGRPAQAREGAKEWIVAKLKENNDQVGNQLQAIADREGVAQYKTFWRAIDDLVADGELVVDRQVKPYIVHLIK